MKLLRTKTEYADAIARIHQLEAANANASQADEELDMLRILVAHYEREQLTSEFSSPVEAIRFYMDRKGLKQVDLVPFIGSESIVSKVLCGKRPLTVNMIRQLHMGCGIPLETLIGCADQGTRKLPVENFQRELRESGMMTGKLFEVSGIKLIHALLVDPFLDKAPDRALINRKLKDIKQTVGISTGSISELFKEMKLRGFMAADDRGKLLVDRKYLLERWLTAYTEYRFRRRKIVHLQAPDHDWWRHVHIADHAIRWGGETAGAILTKGFLRPEIVTMYSDSMLYDFALAHGLQRVAVGGNTELLAPMPGEPWSGHPDCVHPLLVYADLIATRNDRNRETAERIYDSHLRSIIEFA